MISCVVIVCKNEAQNVGTIIDKAKGLVDMVVVADDASTDNTVQVALEHKALVVCNEGKKHGTGANTQSGIDFALSQGADFIVCMDGDGQHNASEVPSLLAPLLDGYDVVLGSRQYGGQMPVYRRIGNSIVTQFFNLGRKSKITDTQCGFRAFNRSVLQKFKITERHFGFGIEITVKCKTFGKIREVPIMCTYHADYKQNSSMNPIWHGLRLFRAVFRWRLGYELPLWGKNIVWLTFKRVTRILVGHKLGVIVPLGWIYRKLCYLLIPQQDKLVDIGGVLIRARVEKGRDVDGISNQLILNKVYEPIATQVFNSLVKPSMRVIDVGANIGYYTLLACKLVGDSGEVIAYEPEPRNFEGLQDNIRLNKLTNAKLNCAAVSNYIGIGTFYLSDKESGAHSLILCRDYKKYIKVPVVVLDELEGSFDFIKIDTEGNEMGVLEGARRIIASSPNLEIMLEVWVDGLKSAGYTPELLWAKLAGMGFDYIYLIDEFKKGIYSCCFDDIITHYRKHKFGINIVCSKKGVFLHELGY